MDTSPDQQSKLQAIAADLDAARDALSESEESTTPDGRVEQKVLLPGLVRRARQAELDGDRCRLPATDEASDVRDPTDEASE